MKNAYDRLGIEPGESIQHSRITIRPGDRISWWLRIVWFFRRRR